MHGVPGAPADLKLHLAASLGALLPVLLALLLAWQWGWRDLARPTGFELRMIEADSTVALAELFSVHGYHWPPTQGVPPLAVRAMPADLAELPVVEKKALFFRILLPLALAENRRLEEKRRWLLGLLGQGEPTAQALQQLESLAERYRIGSYDGLDEAIELLLVHIDTVPEALVLAQAANESGWGSSRFVLEGNNLFGEWTWQQSEGITPMHRLPDTRHYVRRFDTLQDSVRSYLYNLNAGHAYGELRAMRARMRREGELDALHLAGGLLRYSVRGEAYVAEIRQMIRDNQLHQLGPLQLRPSFTRYHTVGG